MEIAVQIGAYKKENALPVRDRERERAVVQRLCESANPELRDCIEAVYSALFDESSRRQL